MKPLKIVCINITHSQEDEEVMCKLDSSWVDEISRAIAYDYALYITPRSRDTYIHEHFVNQTLDEDGYVTPGDYTTTTPELGIIEYSIWNERSDYYKTLSIPVKLKPTFWEWYGSFLRMIGWLTVVMVACCVINNIFKHSGFSFSIYPGVIGFLFAMLWDKNETIKRLKEKK